MERRNQLHYSSNSFDAKKQKSKTQKGNTMGHVLLLLLILDAYLLSAGIVVLVTGLFSRSLDPLGVLGSLGGLLLLVGILALMRFEAARNDRMG